MTAIERIQLIVIGLLLVLLLVVGIALALAPTRADVNLWRDRTANWKARAETAEAEVRRLQRADLRQMSRQTFAVPLPQQPPAVKAETQTLVLTDLDAT